MRRYHVPYIVSYDNLTRFWEVLAITKEEALQKTIEQLSSDDDVLHIGGIRQILDMGKAQ